MTIAYNITPVVPPTPLDWLQTTFRLWWDFEEGSGDALEIRNPISPLLPPVRAIALPSPVSKTNEDREWNRESSSGNQRRTHHFMLGLNSAGIDRHAIVLNTRYNDDGFPYLAIWDWINGVTYGPLFPSDSVKQLMGPILIDGSLYFVTVDAVDFKARLWVTNANLTLPGGDGAELGGLQVGTETATIATNRSTEFMAVSGDFIGILESPAAHSGAFVDGWAWNYAVPGFPAQISTVDIPLNYSLGLNYNEPNRKATTDDSFMIMNNLPVRLDSITAASYEAALLFLTGDWGTQQFGGFQQAIRNFTIRDDGTTVFYSYQGDFNDYWFGERTWRDGTVIVPDAVFDSNALVPLTWRAMYFPFET